MFRHGSYLFAFLILLASACGGGGSSARSGGGDDAEALSVLLRWRVSADAEGFIVHWGMYTGPYTDELDVGMPPVDAEGITSFLLDDLPEAGTYVFALSAYDVAGQESALSNAIVVTIP